MLQLNKRRNYTKPICAACKNRLPESSASGSL